MKPERWREITDIFEAALRRDPASLPAYLGEACADDKELRREVEALLASHEQAANFIEEPALAVAARSGDGASLAGQTIGHYQVVSLLGAGGMGDVYLALDSRLGRKAALKLLPDYLAADAERVRLFTKEARAASALNHPNIITVYEIGQVENRYYIAMEYVDGVTLFEKIHREKAPLPKLLKYLQQVAEGLTKAHAAGIVHRDLKPENIMITRDGYAKVLDFGLAKLIERKGDGEIGGRGEENPTRALSPLLPVSPTASTPGVVMGTAGYMSPEQAQGRVKEIDHRSDIFSFGSILYEAVTGQQAFDGKDVLDSLYKIVHAPTPRIKQINPQAPDDLERIVRRCLAKDPEQRYHSIKDVAIELEDIQQALKSQTELTNSDATVPGHSVSVTNEVDQRTAIASTPTTDVTAHPTSSAEYLVGEIKRHKRGAALVLAVILLLTAGPLLVLWRAGYFGRVASRTIPFEQMKFTRLTTTGKAISATISPDGKWVAYLNIETGPSLGGSFGTASMWVKQVATGRDIRIVEKGQFVLRGLTFSPDSNYVYYRVRDPKTPGDVYRIPVLGGDPQKVLSSLFSPITFSADSKRVAFVRNHVPVVGDSNVLVANADGTNERIVTTHRGGDVFATPGRPTAPAWSPDGKMLACAVGTINGSNTLLEVQIENGKERSIGSKRWSWIDSLVWVADGSALLLTARDETSPQLQIWEVAYPSGEARRVTNTLDEFQDVSLSADSSQMVVVRSARESYLWLAPANKPAEMRPVTSGTGKADGSWGISWTPDGKLVYGSNASGNRDIWLVDAVSGTQKQLTANVQQNFNPVVTPDGRYIVFSSDRGNVFGLWRMDIDGANPKQLTEGPLQGQVACSPDSKWVVYSSTGSKGIPVLWKIGIEQGSPVKLNDDYWEELPNFSPDGKSIVFQFFEQGKGSMRLGQMPAEGGPVTEISPLPFRFGPTIKWTPDGKAIAYLDHRGGFGNIWALPIAGKEAKPLTDFKADVIFWFDWSRDGKQLAMARGSQISDVVLITNSK